MNKVDVQAILEKIKAYLISNAKHRLIEINHDTDLIDAGLMDSLRLMGLIVLIEESLGAQIPLHEISVEKLKSLDHIQRNFLEVEQDEEAFV